MGFSGLGVAVLTSAALSAGVVVVATAVSDEGGHLTTRTTVTRVVDGDTVEIASGEHVRLIGVDTPEHGTCGFKEATKAMRRMVEGHEVVLVNPVSVQDLDKYERLLRYVEVGKTDAGLTQLRAGRGRARYDSLDGYDRHPRQERYRKSDENHEDTCGERERLRARRQRIQDERWEEARRLANRADIAIKDGETAAQVLRRAQAVIDERQRLRKLARNAPPPPPPPAPAPSPPPPAPAPTPSAFVPPAGWTTDALTPGYTGCRQGYPGGKINGVYVWKPIAC